MSQGVVTSALSVETLVTGIKIKQSNQGTFSYKVIKTFRKVWIKALLKQIKAFYIAWSSDQGIILQSNNLDSGYKVHQLTMVTDHPLHHGLSHIILIKAQVLVSIPQLPYLLG